MQIIYTQINRDTQNKLHFKTYSYRLNPNNLKNMRLGVDYYNNQNQLVSQPMDFADRNYISLETLHQILKSVTFPESVLAHQRFHLTPED